MPETLGPEAPTSRHGGKSPAAFRTIAEVAHELDLPQHVLRFWETKFPQVKPLKRGGGRRYYRPEDVVLLRHIRDLLHREGYTIRGAQKVLRDKGRKADDAEPCDADDGGGNGAPLDRAVRDELRAVVRELQALRRLLDGGGG